MQESTLFQLLGRTSAPLMDIIFITDLRVETIIGIYDWERTTRQMVSIDLQMGTDIRTAAETDNIDNTPSYKDVAKRLVEYIGDSEFFLVETMAEKIAELVRREFSIGWVKVTLHKPGALSDAKDVGIIIERGERL